MTTDIAVPTDQEFVEALGVSPVLLDGGTATYMVEVASGDTELRFSYDLVERSVRVRVNGGPLGAVDFFCEGLDGMSLISKGPEVGLSVRLSGPCHVVRLNVTIFPAVEIRSEVLAA
ncbi:hypothetical protein [Actinosynnema sp. NPDC023587]|uniref:hypothetical protein n=1 Tax=Actinosynnema sp. NPDC023587 TaxID=3154695 RepID=UPI0033CED8EF